MLSPSDSDPLGEADDTIVEGDETAVGKRKYQRGKRSRQAGTQWAQTLLEVSVNEDGSRTPDLFFLFLGMLIVLDFKEEEKDLSDLIASLSL